MSLTKVIRSVSARFPSSVTFRNFSATTSNMSQKYFMLQYNYVPDVVEKRAPLRGDHLKLARQYLKEGKLLLGGAFADPIDSAAILFRTDDVSDVETFVKSDPYVLKGIVTDWKIREWTVVVDALRSEEASVPVRHGIE